MADQQPVDTRVIVEAAFVIVAVFAVVAAIIGAFGGCPL